MPPVEPNSEIQRDPRPQPVGLQQKVISLLMQDLNIPQSSPVEVRQPPVNGDDDDSWAMSNEEGAFDYLAQQLIETILSDDSNDVEPEEEEEL